jgi:protein-S-isoprenylcysteine O-methyltransferase Ste14
MNTSSVSTADRIELSRYQRRRRLSIFIAIICLSALLLFTHHAWTHPLISFSIRSIGIVLIAFGILGRMWSTLYIGGRKSNAVVTEGPYSIMRNPLYFFSSIAALGVGAQTGSIIMAILVGLLCVVAFLIVIKREETFLSDAFGEPYANYCARVPRFFPRFSLFQDPESVTVLTKLVYRTLADGLVFYVAVPLLLLVDYAQTAGWLPVFLRLY